MNQYYNTTINVTVIEWYAIAAVKSQTERYDFFKCLPRPQVSR